MAQIVWRAIRSRGAYVDSNAFVRYVQDGLVSETGPTLIQALQSQVPHWKIAPTFSLSVSIDTSGIGVHAYPTGRAADLWRWSSRGVRGRYIRPRTKKALKFKSAYSPIRPTSAQQAHLGFAFSKGHWWPGIRPRNYEEVAAQQIKPIFQRQAENIIRRAVTRARKETY